MMGTLRGDNQAIGTEPATVISRPGGALASVNIDRSPGDVFAQLCDAPEYPRWLIGAQRVVHVDDDWPAVGSRFHHRIGVGPFRVAGSTTIRVLEPDRRLVLGAGMGPFGEALVDFELTPEGEGSTQLAVAEAPERGLARWVARVAGPLIALAVWGRNGVSLAELRNLVERRVPRSTR